MRRVPAIIVTAALLAATGSGRLDFQLPREYTALANMDALACAFDFGSTHAYRHDRAPESTERKANGATERGRCGSTG